LYILQFCGFGLARIGRKILTNEEVPDLFAPFPGVKRFVLSITNSTEFFVRRRRFGPITFADQLDDTFALIDLLSQDFAEIAALCSKDVLPHRLVSQKRERIRDQLAGAAQFATNCRNKN
jgi:hypothetical protein